MKFDEALAFALTLPGTDASTHYGQPAAEANGHAFLNVGHEPDTSFVLHLDRELIELLMETRPETFWQTPHYRGYAAVLVRHDGDATLVRDMIGRAHARAAAKRPRKPRA